MTDTNVFPLVQPGTFTDRLTFAAPQNGRFGNGVIDPQDQRFVEGARDALVAMEGIPPASV